MLHHNTPYNVITLKFLGTGHSPAQSLLFHDEAQYGECHYYVT